MLEEDIQPLQAMLKENEGCESNPYLDSAVPGNVTCGVGHLLATVAEAQGLPFRLTETGLDASAQEIQNAYNTLKSKGRTASNTVRKCGTIFLAPADIDALLMADLRGTDNYLHAIFSVFDSYPQPVRMAVTDMSYNLGSLSKWPRLRAAILEQNWTVAANECRREGIGEGRNGRTKALFLSAIEPASISG